MRCRHQALSQGAVGGSGEWPLAGLWARPCIPRLPGTGMLSQPARWGALVFPSSPSDGLQEPMDSLQTSWERMDAKWGGWEPSHSQGTALASPTPSPFPLSLCRVVAATLLRPLLGFSGSVCAWQGLSVAWSMILVFQDDLTREQLSLTGRACSSFSSSSEMTQEEVTWGCWNQPCTGSQNHSGLC